LRNYASDSLAEEAGSDEALLRELAGLWKYQVRRFRIVYEIDRKKRMIKMFAIGHRREVYEELAERFRQLRQQLKREDKAE